MASKVSVASLNPADKSGWCTKQGGSIKTWKRRWFVLKGDTVFYFKTQKDLEVTGTVKLEKTTVCQLESDKSGKKKYYYSVGTPTRTYLVYADTEAEAKAWTDKINQNITQLRGGNAAAPAASSTPAAAAAPDAATPAAAAPAATTAAAAAPADAAATPAPAAATPSATGGKEMSARQQIALAKGVIPFLQDEESKVLEFWQIWSNSIPAGEDLQQGMVIEYHVSTSADMQKLTWRTCGPQNVFIQKMVDFFWNVGAPETEIDRLNDVGALINPLKIGSWIDMSQKGGMDGGWYFPVDIPIKMAIEAADAGIPTKKVLEWSEKHNIDKGYSVGRDMGAAPPRQTEIRIKLPGASFDDQLTVALDAFTMFGFTPIPDNAMEVLKSEKSAGLCLSVITSSEGFVRLGLMAPKPSKAAVLKLCEIAGAKPDALGTFEGALGTDGPAYAEYQYLKEGFGYGVYREGFDVVFHYSAGNEEQD